MNLPSYRGSLTVQDPAQCPQAGIVQISGTFTFWARRPQNEPTARILPNESKLCLAISIAAEDSIVTLHHLVYLYDQAPRSMLYGERDAITFSASHRKPAIRLIYYTTVNDRMMSRVPYGGNIQRVNRLSDVPILSSLSRIAFSMRPEQEKRPPLYHAESGWINEIVCDLPFRNCSTWC